MTLTEAQADAFGELINIGYGRAAAALSEMTGYRIVLQAPHVALYDMRAVEGVLKRDLNGDVACVTQVFSGPIAGNAMWVLDLTSALRLSALLDDQLNGKEFDRAAGEAIAEAGHILLNACLGAFGNLLEMQVGFSVPRLELNSVAGLLNTTAVGGRDLQHALIVRTRFQLRASNVTGYILFIFGLASVERMLDELKQWDGAA